MTKTKTAQLPRYNPLTIAIRAALYGAAHPLVLHMVQRNQGIDLANMAERLR